MYVYFFNLNFWMVHLLFATLATYRISIKLAYENIQSL